MDKIPFEDGIKTQEAYVTIDEQDYNVTPAQYEGKTPLSAFNLNKMQDNIESAINERIINNKVINGFPLGDTKRGNIYVQYDKNMYIVTFNFGIKDNFNVSGWSDIANISLPFMNKMATETHIIANQSDETNRTIAMKVYMTPDSNILRFGNLGQSYSNVKQNDIWFRGQLVGFIK